MGEACPRPKGAGNVLIFQTVPIGAADNSREAAKDWNAGVPPASVRNAELGIRN
ncbi:MAG: hypothetical protein LBQ66_14405 [Planctomycetaceae bacterium]|nr:hypothetical protein [Planctomycetaceae bacterium]